MNNGFRIERASDRSLLAVFGREVSPAVHARVRGLFAGLLQARVPGVLNLHPAYASLLVDFDPLRIDFNAVAAEVERCVTAGGAAERRRITIPVRYGGEFGPDLRDVAAHCGLTTREVVARHSAGEYLVYFIGFSPGFPYLGGLDSSLATPRLATPRKSVPAGSVAIGGSQTGVYPMQSPGGWRIIGRTPARLFDARRPPYALLSMGDIVRFEPVKR